MFKLLASTFDFRLSTCDCYLEFNSTPIEIENVVGMWIFGREFCAKVLTDLAAAKPVTTSPGTHVTVRLCLCVLVNFRHDIRRLDDEM